MRCRCVNKKKSPPRGWPCCEPLRRLVSLSGATSLYVTLWTVSEIPDQSIKRAFCEERKWLSVRPHSRFSLCSTLKRCYCDTALLWHFYKGLVTVSPAPKRCYYRSVFAVECTLSADSSARRQVSEAKTIMNGLAAGFHVKDERSVSERVMALTGAGEFRPPFPQFPVFVRWSVLLFSRLVSHRNGVILCCSVGIVSAVQTAGTPRCPALRTEHRAPLTWSTTSS